MLVRNKQNHCANYALLNEQNYGIFRQLPHTHTQGAHKYIYIYTYTNTTPMQYMRALAMRLYEILHVFESSNFILSDNNIHVCAYKHHMYCIIYTKYVKANSISLKCNENVRFFVIVHTFITHINNNK